MNLAPHEHAQPTQKTAEFHQPQFIKKVVDDRVTTKRQIPQSKWRCDEAVEKSQIRFRKKKSGGFQLCNRTDAARAVPGNEAKANPSSKEFRRIA